MEEAWRGVNTQFELTERDPSWPDPGPKWPMLVQLRAKAMRIRNANTSTHTNTAHSSVAQGEHQQHQQRTQYAADPLSSVDDAALHGIEAPLLDLNNLDFNLSEFPDWNYLAQGIAIMNQDGGI